MPANISIKEAVTLIENDKPRILDIKVTLADLTLKSSLRVGCYCCNSLEPLRTMTFS